ncbi:uncharacterized protein BDV14DRAFT_210965 [Aspergillus stella-maris]|uniref:uncharacterized protein n=1 Tax=Aspergillus stella-maris TaxID=1810926 RepID=UPI003CCD3F30
MTRPISQRRAPRLLMYVVSIVIILIFLIKSPFLAFGNTDYVSSRAGPTPLDAIKNGTLGVQKIFAINLPSRHDKRDNMVLGAALNGFQVEVVDAVTPDEINPKTYPYNWKFEHRPAEYAARRSHLNVMRRIVSERIQSAMIMEDDADWDVSFKTQLQSFAIAVRALQKPEATSPTSPYGDDWDVLWLRHCGIDCKNEQPYFLTPNDPTIVPPAHFLPYWRDIPPLERPDDARLTCEISDGTCSIVYAVSLRGAQRLLAALSVAPAGIAEKVDIGAQFDVSFGRLCGSGYLRCFALYPSLTGGYKAAGSAGKGSDINAPETEDDGEKGKGAVEPAFSHGVMYSTMLNIQRILAGQETVLATWDDVPVREFRIGDVPALEGVIKIQMPMGEEP